MSEIEMIKAIATLEASERALETGFDNMPYEWSCELEEITNHIDALKMRMIQEIRKLHAA